MVKQNMPMEKGAPDELMPLREPTFFILLALSKERKHGYAILKEVEALSEGRTVLSTGTLYGALARLLEQGVVRNSTEERGGDGQGLESRPGKENTRGRKYYELTELGRRVLEAEIKRMSRLLATASRELANVLAKVLGEEGV